MLGLLRLIRARRERSAPEVPGDTFYSRHVSSIIYGANDGIVTTFAIISSAMGASLGTVTIIILGLANLFADGFSMGSSSYLSAKSEHDVQKKQGNGADLDPHEPRVNGAITFGAFVCAGTIPLLPFLLPISMVHPFAISVAATAVAFFVVGGMRSIVSPRSFIVCGLEMLFVGGIAASIAFGIGFGIERLVS